MNTTDVAIGAGTDAHRVSTYNPFTVLQRLLDGRAGPGIALRGTVLTMVGGQVVYAAGPPTQLETSP